MGDIDGSQETKVDWIGQGRSSEWDMAKDKKNEHIVYSSVVNADKNIDIPHFDSEGRVEQTLA